MKKVRLIHPITHSGTEFSRGIHELDDALADLFVTSAPHAAEFFSPETEQAGKTTKAADAEEGLQLTEKAKAMFEAGATIDDVARELNISKTAAKKIRAAIEEKK